MQEAFAVTANPVLGRTAYMGGASNAAAQIAA
jgi:hypothetical protein